MQQLAGRTLVLVVLVVVSRGVWVVVVVEPMTMVLVAWRWWPLGLLLIAGSSRSSSDATHHDWLFDYLHLLHLSLVYHVSDGVLHGIWLRTHPRVGALHVELSPVVGIQFMFRPSHCTGVAATRQTHVVPFAIPST